MRKLNNLDMSLCVLLLLITAWMFYLDITGVFLFNANDVNAIFLLVFSVFVMFGLSGFARYFLIALLILSTFNAITITYTIDGTEYSGKSSLNIGHFSFNPLGILFFFFYCVIDRKFIWRVFRGTEADQKAEKKKMEDFYYKKFEVMNDLDLGNALKDFEEYPLEAQLALSKIKREKSL